MKLFKVTARETYHGAYEEFIIWANTPAGALALAQDKAHRERNFEEGATVTEIEEPEDAAILSASFIEE